MEAPLYKIGDRVRATDINSGPEGFVVNAISHNGDRYVYSNSQPNGTVACYWFVENRLEKVVPKKLFYQWVSNATGRLNDLLLDEYGTDVRGVNRINVALARYTRIGDGFELALINTPEPSKKTAKVYEEDDERWS